MAHHTLHLQRDSSNLLSGRDSIGGGFIRFSTLAQVIKRYVEGRTGMRQRPPI